MYIYINIYIYILCTITPAYIRSSQHSDEEKKDRVLCALVLQEADATLERLMVCLAEDSVHSNHCYMARKLREALDAKRQHPECEY